MMKGLLCVVVGVVCVSVFAAPIEQPNAALSTPQSGLSSMDLGLTVFDQNSASTADHDKNYIILAFDNESCKGENQAKCDELEQALFGAMAVTPEDAFAKYRPNMSFGKANKDDFPDHKKEFEKAKVPLPAVLFWPAGHSRPSCKFDTPHATKAQMADWLLTKLKDEEDDDLLQLDEGEAEVEADPKSLLEKIDDVSLLVCQADGGPNVVVAEDLTCGDLMDDGAGQQLVQTEKTQKIWDFSEGKTKQVGAADNSLPHVVAGGEGDVKVVDAPTYQQLSSQSKWVALYFHAPWCHYCECLDPVWKGVSSNLVESKRQPELVLGKVDGDANPDLRGLLNVTAYPTFILINKEGTKILGRYLGPRKVFELSNWIEDLIVAAENPVVKKEFEVHEQGEVIDMHPVFPYSGPKAFGDESMAAQALATVSVQSSLGGNEFDECLESDEAKFTAPGAALLVHYGDSTHSLEMDGQAINVDAVPDKFTVIDFYAPWCPHCQKLNPVWDALSTKLASGDVVVGKVDMEAHPDVKKQFGIKRFPTIMYFEPGKKMAFDESRRYVGQRDVDHLEAWVQQHSKPNV